MNYRSLSLLISLLLLSTSLYAAPGDVFYVDQKHASASDSNPGTENLPWLTIQKAADTLKEGETVYVKEGIYTELTGGRGNYNGIIPRNSGTTGNPITYEAYPDHVAVIDQRGVGMGFYINDGVSHITIRGFEIRNAFSGGVRTENQSIPRSEHIVIEENYIHHITGPWGHNVGGVRIDLCYKCVVRNNTIHDISILSDPQTNSAGIHSYRMSYATIENNKIWNSYNGIFFKQAHFDGEPGGTIQRNVFHNVSEGIRLTPQGSGFPGHQEIHIKENIFYNFSRGIRVLTGETSTKSSGLYISNNTFDDGVPYVGTSTPECFVINGYTNVQIWNNICTVEVPIETHHLTAGFNFTTNITYMDHNLYHNYKTFRLDRYGTYLDPIIPYLTFSSIDNWTAQATNSDTISVIPDTKTTTLPPQFVDWAARDYRLQASSPALGKGRDGENIGAYSNNGIFIGPQNRFTGTSAEADTNPPGQPVASVK